MNTHLGSAGFSDPAASLWVSANAGAGKTHVLIDRVAGLLIAGAPPEKILCLTFTKAAAAEMTKRLSVRLGTWAMADDATLRTALSEIGIGEPDAATLRLARRLFARALETPGALKIQTIHAFCERLLGRFPLEAGITPHFEVIDELSANELLGEAKNAILSAVASGLRPELEPAIARLAELGEGCFDLAVASLRKITGAATAQDSSIVAALGLVPGETGDSIRAAAIAATPEAELRRAVRALAEGSTKDRARAEGIAQFLEANDRATAFGSYCRAYLKTDGEPIQDLATRSIRGREPEIGDILSREQDRIAKVSERLRAAECAADSRAGLAAGKAVLAQYAQRKRARGALDYDDLIRHTVNLLSKSGSAAWVLYKLDGGLDHILVDEAQDTSPLQWEVIRLLAEEFFAGEGARGLNRTIFAVGDEKQSIFSFQGADPAAFAQMRRHFETRVKTAGSLFAMPTLAKSRRSTEPVLHLVDEVFSSSARQSALAAGGVPLKHELHREGEAGLVELWPTEKPEKEEEPRPWDLPLDYVSPTSAMARAANSVARKIADWIRRGEILESEGRPITPGDILILVRRRNAFVDLIIRQLKAKNIRVAGADRLILTDHIAIMDLLAAASFALLPEDDYTLAALMKSPLLGLSEEDLYAIAYGRSGSLWQAFGAHARQSAAIAAAFDFASDLLRRADQTAPHAFFAEILGLRGGRKNFLARLGDEVNDPIEEFLARALHYERTHSPSLQGFVHWLERGSAEIKRDLEQGRDEVRVMTVHGAKGLQANIVILPDTCSSPYGGHVKTGFMEMPVAQSAVPLWWRRMDDAPPLLKEARARDKAKEEAEHLRLLYVAMTRARDRLYICGYESKKGMGAWYPHVETAIKKIGKPIELEDGRQGWRLASAQTMALPKRKDLSVRMRTEPLPGWIAAPLPRETREEPLRPSHGSTEGDDEQIVSPLAADDRLPRYQRGRLIHRLLETLPALPQSERASAARRFLALPIHNLAADAQVEILDAALLVLADTRFAALFASGSRAEAAITGKVSRNGRSYHVHGVVDRLAVTDAHVLIIDYKTNRPPPESLVAVPIIYLRQMALYRALLSQIYPERVVECALLWTDGPSLMALPAAILDETLENLLRLDATKAAS